ncbi:MAG: ribosome silencing factor [Oscillospiraceae bacterium]|jgi:ribosome-associated protein|nr:ribosome silencing factor [Oscillospiraceae bacterium]
MTPKEVMELAVKALIDKKAKDIIVLKTTELTILADYFIIASGGSLRQLRTLTDETSKVLEESGEPALRTEGYRAGGWTLTDFGSIVVHLFLDEIRQFYDLERLWSDAVKIDIDYLTE